MIRCCKDCTERHLGCHDTCDIYKAEKDAHLADKAGQDAQKAEKRQYLAYSDRVIWRRMKQNKK